ncbi:MAG: EscU/YscU/HrcU family type III secretion system export apparatus switch protein, partial [Pseudomonadota bacterium]
MSGGGEDDGQEKIFDPTPQKLQQAREKGDVPKSNDINAAAMYVGVCLTLIIAGSSVGNDLGAPLAAMLARPEEFSTAFLGSGYGTMTGSVLSSIALAILPVFLIPFAAVILSLVAQRAFVVAPSKLEMKLNRISPISNAKNKFGPQGLVEFLKSLVKLIIVANIAGVVIWSLRGDLYTMMAVDARAMPRYLAETGMILLIATTILAGVIGAADMLWQVHSHRQKLRMSLQEMRDETKQSEGD